MPSFDNAYGQQLSLLVDVLPHVAAERDFALKGGTAINLFYRDLPRLSVDIDLAWLPLGGRAQALAGVAAALERISGVLRDQAACRVQAKNTADGVPTGLTISRQGVPIKIDVTPVLRGSVFPPEVRLLQPAAADRFGLLEVQCLGFADLYAGKLVAALDRQHPRDLFDVLQLLATEGITPELWSAFLVYMVEANRPIAELIDPNRLPLSQSFLDEFAGMAGDEEEVDVSALEQAREQLISDLQGRLDANAREFLLSFERESPTWGLLGLPEHVPDLPAVRWKLMNLAKRSAAKRDADYRQLADTLDRIGRKDSA